MKIWQLSQADCWSNRARICQNTLSPILKNPGVSCLYLLIAGRTVRVTVPSLYNVKDWTQDFMHGESWILHSTNRALYPGHKRGPLPMVTSLWWQAPQELSDIQQTAVVMVKDPHLGIPGL